MDNSVACMTFIQNYPLENSGQNIIYSPELSLFLRRVILSDSPSSNASAMDNCMGEVTDVCSYTDRELRKICHITNAVVYSL